jgi:hypothetical protein
MWSTVLLISHLWLLALSKDLFPLANGFPDPNATQLLTIEQHGLGTLPNSNLPSSISAQGLINFQLIALNELAEVAFFTELLWNITNDIDGYDIPLDDLIINSLVAAQNVRSMI